VVSEVVVAEEVVTNSRDHHVEAAMVVDLLVRRNVSNEYGTNVVACT
jgi:hypothetical protein